MPLNEKGRKIMKSMKKQYGKKRGETVFYASKNKGVIKGVEKKKQGEKMEKLDNIKEVKVGEQQTEIDPRSKTTADKAFNLISTGGPEIEVQGQGKVMPEKRRKSKAY